MCLTPDVPDPPAPVERQAAKQPSTDPRARLADRDKRRRGYAAAMFAPATIAAPGTTNITGV